MTNKLSDSERLQTNAGAAFLLAYPHIRRTNDDVLVCKGEHNPCGTAAYCVERKLDIFADTPQGAADREALMIVLCKDHGFLFQCQGHRGFWFYINENGEESPLCKEYVYALAAAVNEVMK